MTTRESLHQLVEQLSDEDVESLARLASEKGLPVGAPMTPSGEAAGWIEARQYPALAATWDNDNDAIFDNV